MKVLIIRDLEGNPLYIAQVTELGELDYYKIKKECEKTQKAAKESLDKRFVALGEEIAKLIHEVKHLKGED